MVNVTTMSSDSADRADSSRQCPDSADNSTITLRTFDLCAKRHNGSPWPSTSHYHIANKRQSIVRAKSPTNLSRTCLLSMMVRVLGLFQVTHSKTAFVRSFKAWLR